MANTRFPLFTGAYSGVSPNANMEALINWYLEASPKGERNPVSLIPTPGYTKFADLVNAVVWNTSAAAPATGPIKGIYSYDGNIFVVAVSSVDNFDHLYAVLPVDPPFLPTILDYGSLGTTNVSYYMADNNPNTPIIGVGQQLAIVSPTGTLWTFNSGTNVLAVVGVNFQNGNMITYQDGYGIYPELSTNTFWVTSPYNFRNTPALNFESLESTSGNLVAVKSDNTYLYILGTTGLEVWYDSGDPAFPFTRIPGAIYAKGCLGYKTLQKCDNSMIWLGTNEYGQAQVYQMRGTNPPVRISTTQIEWQLNRWVNPMRTIGFAQETCFAFVYQEKGHEFYVLTYMPTNGSNGVDGTYPNTFVYDVSTQQWHVRQSVGTGNNTSWLPGYYCFYNGSSGGLIGGKSGAHVIALNNQFVTDTGLYYLDASNATENGTAITRVAVSGHINNSNERVFIGSAEIVLGWSLDTAPGGTYPNIPVGSTLNLSWAKDGNFNPTSLPTFTPPYTFASNFTYTITSVPGQRMKWYQCGTARDWVFQLTTTANQPILDSFVELRYQEQNEEP